MEHWDTPVTITDYLDFTVKASPDPSYSSVAPTRPRESRDTPSADDPYSPTSSSEEGVFDLQETRVRQLLRDKRRLERELDRALEQDRAMVRRERRQLDQYRKDIEVSCTVVAVFPVWFLKAKILQLKGIF
jgi:hypothetical protein